MIWYGYMYRNKAIRLIYHLAEKHGKGYNALHEDLKRWGHIHLSHCSPEELQIIAAKYDGKIKVKEESIILAIKCRAEEAGITGEGITAIVVERFGADNLYELLKDQHYRRIRGLFKVIKYIKEKNLTKLKESKNKKSKGEVNE